MKFTDLVPGDKTISIPESDLGYFWNIPNVLYVHEDLRTISLSPTAVNQLIDMICHQKKYPEYCGPGFCWKWSDSKINRKLQDIHLRVGYDSYYGDNHIMITPFPVVYNKNLYKNPDTELFRVTLCRNESLRLVSENFSQLNPGTGFYKHTQRFFDHLELVYRREES